MHLSLMFLPQAVDHELALLFTHSDTEQRADLTQRGQEVYGILHGFLTDGVAFSHGTQKLADAIVLPSKEAEHASHQLWVQDFAFLSPAHHCL